MVNEPDRAAKDRHGKGLESFGRKRLGPDHRPPIEFACMTFDEDTIYSLDDGLNKARTYPRMSGTPSPISRHSGAHPTLPGAPPL